MRLSEERYISLLTDFGFKQELREYEDSLKAYRDIKNSIDTAKEEGREEGRVEGREEGMEYLNQLNKYLLKSKRYNDLERATEDIEYQKKLLKELGIE